ncbi:thrombospondin type 3 repeat-containing protein [Chryseobacterium tructae]|uniref:Thrombospondin type 3 repeat-containing protein n=1 Tax=Chryseobacterium tructae TaxID=1037380 RepID=A0ABV7XYH9_9FLAO
MRKILLLLLFLFAATSFHTQTIENQEAFKKCRKEFNKKICLSDEDQDNIPLYLDKCPIEAGAAENNGCPWPDTDKDGTLDKDDQCPEIAGSTENAGCPWPDYDNDGILDKDDACPTIPGLPENSGCPRPTQQDCGRFQKQQQIKYEQFQEEHQNIGAIYSLLNKKIMEDVLASHKKEALSRDFGINIGYIQFTSICGVGCDDPYPRNINNFLISKFWNKDIFEYTLKKYNKEILIRRIVFHESMNTELESLMGKETFQYLLQYHDKESDNIIIPSKNKIRPKNYIPIYIQFITPFKIKVVDPTFPKIYEYKNGQWESYKE